MSRVSMFGFLRYRVFLSGFFLGLGTQVLGQTVRFEPYTFFVGDSVNLLISFDMEPGKREKVGNPENLPESNWFDIRSARVEKISDKVEINITFIAYAPGHRILPPIRFGSLLVKDIMVPVSSISRGNTQPFRSIRGQVFLPGTGLFAILILIFILVLPLIISSLWRMARSFSRKIFHFYQSRLPGFILKKRLGSLRTRMDTDSPTEWYSHLTDSLRSYISAKTGQKCQSATTEEIAMMTELNIPDSLQSQIISILRDADMVKFAGRPVSSPLPGESLNKVTAAMVEWEKIRV